MYNIFIGKLFRKKFNEKFYPKDPLSRHFFDEILWPLFFDAREYLLSAQNSPPEVLRKNATYMGYVGRIPKREEVGKRAEDYSLALKLSNSEKASAAKNMRLEARDLFHEKVLNEPPNMSIAIGFPALGDHQFTSGQVTSIDFPITPEDIYDSWIGAGLGITISGLTLFFNDFEINSILLKGWQEYRYLLDNVPGIPAYKLNSWNGHWLIHQLTNKPEKCNPFLKKGDKFNISPVNWTKFILILAKKFPDKKFTVNVSSLGQSNSTYGILHIDLSEIKKQIDFYENYFEEYGGDKTKVAIEDSYAPHFSFYKVCTDGLIQLKRFEPAHIKDLKKYYVKEHLTAIKKPEPFLIALYLVWVTAMLNNEDIRKLAIQMSKEFVDYELKEKNAKTLRANQVRRVLESKSKTQLFSNFVPLLKNKELRDFITNSNKYLDALKESQFYLFVTLLRFNYTLLRESQESTKNKKVLTSDIIVYPDDIDEDSDKDIEMNMADIQS